MRETYEGKVAVVTGAADGMGLGLCRRLAELGAYVVMGDINGEKLNAEVARINQEHPGHALARVTDVTKKEQIRSLIRKTVEWKGFVHFLFNNAGMGGTLPVDQLELEDWRFLFELNFWSVLQGIYAVLPSCGCREADTSSTPLPSRGSSPSPTRRPTAPPSTP